MAELMIGTDLDVLVPASVLIGIIGVKEQKTVSNYVGKGMPFVHKGKHKLYGIRSCLEWCIKFGYLKVEIELDDDESGDGLPPNMRKDLADARLKELKLQQMREEVVDKVAVVKDAVSVAISLRDNLMAIPSRVSNILANESAPNEIKKLLEKELRNSLEDISSEFME